MMKALVLAGFSAAFLSNVAPAAEFTVNMVNKDAEGRPMQFEPAFLRIAPGDTVHFVSVDKGHNSESLLVPDGAESWKGKISQDISVTFATEGFYAYKCAPHLALGMVGLIQVGESVTDTAPVAELKLPGKAKARMDELLAEQAEAPAAQ